MLYEVITHRRLDIDCRGRGVGLNGTEISGQPEMAVRYGIDVAQPDGGVIGAVSYNFV